jgi:hypothetical protein
MQWRWCFSLRQIARLPGLSPFVTSQVRKRERNGSGGLLISLDPQDLCDSCMCM